MSNSSEFRYLRKRLRELRLRFLPRKFSPTGDYSDLQYDRARAYRLLSHAEIESYFEELALKTAVSAFEEWETSQVLSRPILGMLAY